jgi:hypothetical protein
MISAAQIAPIVRLSSRALALAPVPPGSLRRTVSPAPVVSTIQRRSARPRTAERTRAGRWHGDRALDRCASPPGSAPAPTDHGDRGVEIVGLHQRQRSRRRWRTAMSIVAIGDQASRNRRGGARCRMSVDSVKATLRPPRVARDRDRALAHRGARFGGIPEIPLEIEDRASAISTSSTARRAGTAMRPGKVFIVRWPSGVTRIRQRAVGGSDSVRAAVGKDDAGRGCRARTPRRAGRWRPGR